MFELSGVNYVEVLEQGDSILVRVIASSSYRGFELSGLYCIAGYKLCELIPDDERFHVVFVSDTRSYKYYGCGGNIEILPAPLPPLPPTSPMNILLAIKQHRRY